MKSKINLFCYNLIFLFILVPIFSDEVEIPIVNKFATDLTNTLNNSELEKLESKLSELDKSKTAQILVLIVPTIGEYSVEEFALKIAEKNKVGYKKEDNGLIYLISKKERKIRIEVGYGLEGKITDADSKRIISEIAIPKFKKGEFFEGIDLSINKVIELIKEDKEFTTDLVNTKKESNEFINKNYPLFFVLLLGYFIHLFSGLFIAAILVSIISLFVAPIFVGTGFLLTLFIAFAMFFISIIFNLIGAVFIGGKGGAGFIGGGGSFGGGGASGDW